MLGDTVDEVVGALGTAPTCWKPTYPSQVVTVDGIAEPFSFTLLTLGWVGPCCAARANEWQP
jgi:hypothetical protein